MTSPKTILIVEDDEMTACMLLELLKIDQGYNAINASKACYAFDCIAAVQPDLLIIDYYLPDMNGLDLYQQLLLQERWKHTPVIFLSAILTQEDMRLHQVVGLEKPFEIEDLLALVNQLLVGTIDIIPIPEPVIEQTIHSPPLHNA